MKQKDRQALKLGMLLTILVFALFWGIAGIKDPPEEAIHHGETMEETLPPPPANPYGPDDFRYENGYLTFRAGESMRGIDVSSHQKDIDWQQVADSGIEFAVIRLGFRGYESGIIHADEYAQQNLASAKAVGLKIGAYFFSQAVSTDEAREEAKFALEQLDRRELDLPLVFDWEYIGETARTADVRARELTDNTIAFCETVKKAGYRPMVYFNRYQADQLMYLRELTEYDFWLAMYDEPMNYPYKLDMWQYTSSGSVPGIEGPVDINIRFLYK